MRLPLTEDMRSALAKWRAQHPPMSDGERREDGVTYFGSIGGGYMITFDGRLLEEDWEDHAIREVIEPKTRLTALVIAAERMPAFADLLPVRPISAHDCATCSGVGRWSPAPPHTVICGACGGVGWVADV
jgi:hypothetical protein